MRKIFLCLIFFMFIATGSLYAQVAKIIDVTGRVEFRKTPQSRYVKAKPDTYLNNRSGIKTNKNSECVISFDEKLENVLTIKENSEITIENLKPGKVFMPKGRVFSLIENLPQLGKFEVRTPTAIAGVRGTGDSVEANGNFTTVKCFEGRIGVWGFDSKGNPTKERGLGQGSGLEVGFGGSFGKQFNLGSKDYKDWNAFKKYIKDLKNKRSGGGSRGPGSSFDDLKDEQKDDMKDDFFEDFRKDLHDRSNNGGGQGPK